LSFQTNAATDFARKIFFTQKFREAKLLRESVKSCWLLESKSAIYDSAKYNHSFNRRKVFSGNTTFIEVENGVYYFASFL